MTIKNIYIISWGYYTSSTKLTTIHWINLIAVAVALACLLPIPIFTKGNEQHRKEVIRIPKHRYPIMAEEKHWNQYDEPKHHQHIAGRELRIDEHN